MEVLLEDLLLCPLSFPTVLPSCCCFTGLLTDDAILAFRCDCDVLFASGVVLSAW